MVMCCPPGEYIAELRAAGFAWFPWGLERRSMGVGREVRALGELTPLLAQQRPDVAHAFTIKPVASLSSSRSSPCRWWWPGAACAAPPTPGC